MANQKKLFDAVKQDRIELDKVAYEKNDDEIINNS